MEPVLESGATTVSWKTTGRDEAPLQDPSLRIIVLLFPWNKSLLVLSGGISRSINNVSPCKVKLLFPVESARLTVAENDEEGYVWQAM